MSVVIWQEVHVDDASGRYSTGWFWGNIYWTGSQSLCEHITPKKHIVIHSQNRSRSTRAAGASLNPSSPSAPVGYKDEAIRDNGDSDLSFDRRHVFRLLPRVPEKM
nr:unnamed protein product [Callosobruchus chinensis]